MDQLMIGRLITKKRKELNLTQEQLAEKLVVSNKTISKWETGKSMPDYSIIELLCKTLNITLAELMNGEEEEKSIQTYDNNQVISMLKNIQNLKNTKVLLIGIILIIFGIVMLIFSQLIGNTAFQKVLAAILLGFSIPEIVLGIFLVIKALIYRYRNIGK